MVKGRVTKAGRSASKKAGGPRRGISDDEDSEVGLLERTTDVDDSEGEDAVFDLDGSDGSSNGDSEVSDPALCVGVSGI